MCTVLGYAPPSWHCRDAGSVPPPHATNDATRTRRSSRTNSRDVASGCGGSCSVPPTTALPSQIRTTSTIFGPYQLQEDGHASYWGQLAMRNCLRQAYNGGAVRGGRCVRVANGLNGQGEPQMGLQ